MMRVAVISDTHSRTSSVVQALTIMRERGVELILHCGDIQDGETVELFPAHTHFVAGNCDAPEEIAQAASNTGAQFHGACGQLEIEGTALAFTHGHDTRLLHDLAQSETFDFLFHGHTHVAKEHRTGRTRVINPGALQRVTTRTFLLLDLPSGVTETVVVDR